MSTPSTARAQRSKPSYTARRAQVSAVRQLTPHMCRITLTGPELAHATSEGKDQRMKLLLPLDGQQEPVVPDGSDWYQAYLALPEDIRPWMRTYTIRHHRRENNEIDVDFVLHGDTGPASAWAARTRAGEWIAVVVPDVEHTPVAGFDYRPVDGSEWNLLVGDETALPAIGGILESLRDGAKARVFIEVADLDETQPLPSAGEVEVTWLPRCGVQPGHSELLLECVRNSALPAGSAYAWVAGESAMVQAMRRHLVNDRGMSKSAVYFSGYWRLGGVVG